MFRSPDHLKSRRDVSFGARLTRILAVLVSVTALAVGAAWYLSGRAAGPLITVLKPAKTVGQSGELEVLFEAPGRKIERIEVVLEQADKRVLLYSSQRDGRVGLAEDGQSGLRLVRTLGKRTVAQLEEGKARLRVTATRPVLFGYRDIPATTDREFEVRLRPPVVTALSTFHYINLGGSEVVVYQVSPTAATSGVRVGSTEYPGFPAAGAGIAHADVGLRVAFFAFPWNQEISAPVSLFARDEVGNEGRANFDFRVIPKTFRHGRIELDDRFFQKVVPSILQNSPGFKVERPTDLLASFLEINGDLRKQNGETIAAVARATAPQMLWRGPFKQLVNSAVEGGFADQRTYLYQGKEVDHQVHLGFDLASTAMAPVVAANRGKVVHAKWLGIYGNCVIIDHGMGLQSLYAHLSSIAVHTGDSVEEGQLIGRSGSTGLAGGDHLHFTMLLGGVPVTPIDWWSPKWIQDRVMRKLREAEALGTGQQGTASLH